MRFTIRKKLLVGFLGILVLLAIGSGISIDRISFTDESYKQLIVENVENAMFAKDLNMLYLNQTSSIKSYLLTGNEDYIAQYQNDYQIATETLTKMQEAFKTEKDKQIVKQLADLQLQFNDFVNQSMSLKKEENTALYTELLNSTEASISSSFQENISALDKGQEQLVFGGIEYLNGAVAKTKVFVIVIGVISILIGLTVAIVLSRAISKPIILASTNIQKVAEGDLSMKPQKVHSNDEVGDLVNSFNIMVKDLQEMVGKINESSTSVAASSEELAASAEECTSASEQISRMTQNSTEGHEQQLIQFNELTTSITEMNTGIEQVAKRSEEMFKLTENTSSLTHIGEKFIDHVVGQMKLIQNSVSKASNSINSLRDRSNEISQIIGIITDVAEQTNLLALNAAIEAARAGEHGKGFAVVAEEVRKLAEESKRSASQITDMINHIQAETNESVQMMAEENRQVMQGLKETDDANEAFKSISRAMIDVSIKVEEVSAAVQNMIMVSKQILNAVTMVKEITEKNAENSQESAAATEEQHAALEEVAASAQFLSQMAEDLQVIISKFRIEK